MKPRWVAAALVLAAGACSQAVGDSADGWDRPGGPPASPFALVINELAAAGDPEDWFEVVNASDAPEVLSDYLYGQEIFGEGTWVAFPPDVALGPGERHVQLVTGEDSGFQLGAGEQLGIRDAAGGFVDGIDWQDGDSPDGWSYARIPDLEGEFRPSHHPTPGAPNTP